MSTCTLLVCRIGLDWYGDTVTNTTSAGSDAWADALGRTIKVWRTDIGMSRRQLAQAASISYSYLSAIENGAKVPSTKILRVLAERLGVKAQDLHAAAEDPLSRDAGIDEGATDVDDALIEAQERRFLQRQQARFGHLSTPPSTPTREELARLVDHLDDEDVSVLVSVARRLAALQPGGTSGRNRRDANSRRDQV